MINNSHGKRMVREDLIKKFEELASKKAAIKVKATNIKELSNEVLNSLECGDIVMKKTGNQYHSYIVTYKEANQGICLTYVDASVVETQSYDYVDGAWVYNSEDKTELQQKLTAGDNITIESNVISATVLHTHIVHLSDNNGTEFYLRIYKESATPMTDIRNVITFLSNNGFGSDGNFYPIDFGYDSNGLIIGIKKYQTTKLAYLSYVSGVVTTVNMTDNVAIISDNVI